MKMEHYQSPMIVDTNVALLNLIKKELIEYQHGQNILDKIHKTICLKRCSGTHLQNMNGNIKDQKAQLP